MMVAHYGVCSFKQRRIFLHKFPFSKEIVFFHDWAQIRFAQFFICVAESLAVLTIVVHLSRQSFFRIGGECYVVIVVPATLWQIHKTSLACDLVAFAQMLGEPL